MVNRAKDIVNKLNMWQEDLGEQIKFQVFIEEYEKQFNVVATIYDENGLLLEDVQYVVARSRQTAQQHADDIMNAAARHTGALLKPIQWIV